MNDRLLLCAAAPQGLAARDDGAPNSLAVLVVEYADAVLMRLREVPDPRHPKAAGESATIGVVP